MRRLPVSGWSAALVLLVLAITSACNDDHGGGPGVSVVPAPPSTTVTTTTIPAVAPAGLELTLEQYRSDEVSHIMRVEFHNTSADQFDIATLQLDWPGLVAVDPSTVDYTVFPGQRVALAIDYGIAACSNPPQLEETLPTGPIAVNVSLRDGTTARWPVDDIRHVLERVHTLDCRRQAVESVVQVAFSDTWSPTDGSGTTVAGTLTFTRPEGAADDQPVRIDDVDGSVLIEFALAPGGPYVLAAGEESIAVPVRASGSGNCSPHALADSKKTFEFQLRLTVGDTEASTSITPDQPVKDQLYTSVTATCGV